MAGDACRLCASSSGYEFEPNEEQLELVARYTGVTISPNDSLPKLVCSNCIEKIEDFHIYVENCRRNQQRFSDISSQTNDHKVTDSIGIKVEIEIADFENVKPEFIKQETNVDEDPSNSLPENDPDSDFSGSEWSNDSSEESLIKKKLDRKRKNGSVKFLKNVPKKKKPDPNLKTYIKFSCFVCQENLENWFRLKNHITTEHQQTPSVKCVCGYEMKSKTAIYRHVAGHNDPSCFACDQCSSITKTLVALEAHKLRHIPKQKRNFPCSSCGKEFSSKENLKSHERVHIPVEQRYNYPCTVCGNRFTTKSAVVGHIRAVHEKIKRFVCDICGYSCSTGGELGQHRAIHSDEKLFQCKLCYKRFKTSSNLKGHIDTHEGTKYPCGVCGKVLNSRRTLRKHFLVHDDVCKHVCTFCNRAFKRRQTLKVHLTTHTGDKPIQCPWCPQKFAFSSSLRTHKQKAHYDVINGVKKEVAQE